MTQEITSLPRPSDSGSVSAEEQAAFRVEYRRELLAALTEEPRNPMLSEKLSANLLDHLPEGQIAPTLNRHEQPVVTPSGIDPLLWDEGAIVRSNLEYEHQIIPDMPERLFVHPRQIAPPQDIIDASWQLASGVTAQNGEPRYTFRLGPPLQCIDVPIFTLPGKDWNVGTLAALMQPLAPGSSGARFPFLGGLWVEGTDLPAAAQQALQLGQVAFKGPNFDPAKPASPEENDLIRAVYPMFLHGGRSVILPGNSLVPAVRSPHGGLEILTDPARLSACLQDSAKAAADGFTMMHSIATQYIGVGVRRYVYHSAAKDESGKVDLKPGEIIIESAHDGALAGGAAAVVQRTAYAGERGIFLDMRHQFVDEAPTGGLASGRKAIENDALLLAHGAELSGICIGMVPLLTKETLDRALGHDSGMVCKEIQVVFRAVLDDTLRLNVLTSRCERADSGPTAEFAALIERDYGEYQDQHRDDFLCKVSRTMGRNLAVCCRLGLTVGGHQPTAENLSIYGRITDSENFRKAATPYQIMPLVLGWIKDIASLTRASGYPAQSCFAAPHIAGLVREVLPPSRAAQTIRRLREGAVNATLAATMLCSEIIAAAFERQRVGLPLNRLWAEYCKSGPFRKLVDSHAPEEVRRTLIKAARHSKDDVKAAFARIGLIPAPEFLLEMQSLFQETYIKIMVTMNSPEIVWSKKERAATATILPVGLNANSPAGTAAPASPASPRGGKPLTPFQKKLAEQRKRRAKQERRQGRKNQTGRPDNGESGGSDGD